MASDASPELWRLRLWVFVAGRTRLDNLRVLGGDLVLLGVVVLQVEEAARHATVKLVRVDICPVAA